MNAVQSGNWPVRLQDGSGNTIASTASALNVQCANCSGSGVSTVDTATYQAGVSNFVGFGGAYLTSNTTNPLTIGHQGFAQLTQFRALETNLVNSTGVEIATTTNPLSMTVIGTASVNCSNCSGSGVSTTDTATYQAGSSQFVGVGGAYLTSNTTNPLTVGHQGFAQLTQFRALMTNLVNSSGAEVGTTTNPLTVNVANTNPNGQASMANSSPVVIASNQSTLSAQIVGTNTLTVNCAVGCSAGTGSNASSGVATTTNNLSALSFNYGYNGTTWDQLQVDASKNLKIAIASTNSLTTNVTGTVTITSTSAVQPSTVLNTVVITGNSSLFPVAVLGTNTLSVSVIGTATITTTSALQPVTGTINAVQSGNWPVRLQDGSGNTINSTANALNVQCANCSGSGVSTADTATYQAGVSSFVGIGGAYLTNTTTNPLTIGHQGFAQMTQFRSIYHTLMNSAGTEVGNQTNPLSVSVANATPLGQAVMANSSPVVIATNQSTLSANIAQVNSATLNLTQTTMANSLPVAIASNQSVGDPCMFQTKSSTPIAAGANGVTQILVPGVASKRIYGCSFVAVGGSAMSFSLIEGTGATCGTSTLAVLGGTTALSGLTISANGGITIGAGTGTIAQTATNANNLCLTSSITPVFAGNFLYVQQ